MDLKTSLLGAVAAGIAFAVCWLLERRPRNFGEVRLFPYIPVMMVCLVAVLVLLAHAVSLATGKPVGG